MKTKKWYKSKAIWAGIITVAVSMLKAIDSAFGTNLMDSQIVTLILTVTGVFGIYGRKVADTKIE